MHLAIRRDEVGGDQVVTRQPVFAAEPAKTAPQGQSPNAGIGVCTPGGGQAEGLCLPVKVPPFGAAFRPRRLRPRIDPHTGHQ